MIFSKRRSIQRLVGIVFIVMFLATTLWKVHETPHAIQQQQPFVYLTQTEQCLPSNVTQNLELYNRSKCRCDVIVLSYKEECYEDIPPHFTYLFDNTTTWGSGRNKLFFHAAETNIGYIYYIFLDDDIALKFNRKATPATKQLSPIQAFQNWLLDYEPAVGVVDYIHQRAAQNVRLISRVCKKFVSDISVAIPTIFFDPVFNAFHAKAVGHIFPLDTRHEKDNWWLTDKYLCSVVELKFRGQALLFIPVTVDNLLHRPYPQSRNRTTNAWREFIEDIQKKVPARYANHSLFRRFKEDPEKYLLTSRTYCLSVNRHQDIVPFAHFTRGLKRARVRFSAMIVLYLLIGLCIVSSLNFFFCVYCRLP